MSDPLLWHRDLRYDAAARGMGATNGVRPELFGAVVDRPLALPASIAAVAGLVACAAV